MQCRRVQGSAGRCRAGRAHAKTTRYAPSASCCPAAGTPLVFLGTKKRNGTHWLAKLSAALWLPKKLSHTSVVS